MDDLFVMNRKENTAIMIRIFFRHLREAVQSITRNLGRSVLSCITVGLTLLLMGGFGSVLLNVNKMAHDATTKLEIRVFVDTAATAADTAYLGEELKAIEGVSAVVFSSKDEQLKNIVTKFPTFQLFENDANPLRDAYTVTVERGEHIKTVSEKVKLLRFVYKSNDGGDITENLVAFSKTLQFWGIALISALVIIAVMLIMNTIRSTILSRQTEIEIMRLVGATKWFIRWPFLLEGALVGLLGSVAPALIIYFGYQFIYTMLNAQLVYTQYSLLPFDPYATYIVLALLGVGMLVGAIGSVVSISRFLKR